MDSIIQNCIHNYINNKPLDIVSFTPKSYAFWGKRMCILSLLALLYSAYFLHYPTISNLINIYLIHSIVISAYYIKWKIDEPTTFYMHVFWALPVINSREAIKLNKPNILYYSFDNNNLTMLYFLCNYYLIQNYIYTKRIVGIDNPS